MFGLDEGAYNNSSEEFKVEAQFLKEWRNEGPIGVLVDMINYIRTPMQHHLFAEAQRHVNGLLHAPLHTYLEPVKPVVTRWNSYHDALERAVKLKDAIDKYANDHIERQDREDTYAAGKGNKRPEAPAWMRSGGLGANDWAVITEYIAILRPLKEACQSLEARGRSGKFGAIYEIIPQFEAILKAYESVVESYESVNFNANGAPEDDIFINLRAAWAKLDKYYGMLDHSPMYYASCCLHPYYKNYCANSWRDKPSWILSNEGALQALWIQYKLPSPLPKRVSAPRTSSLRDSIAALVNAEPSHDSNIDSIDQLERWRRFEPAWTSAQFEDYGNPIKYWVAMRPKYPQLAQLALDVLSIPSSSCECERLFSQLGDLLEPRRRSIGSQLLAALQCIKSWRADGFKPPNTAAINESNNCLTDEELVAIYEMYDWDQGSGDDSC